MEAIARHFKLSSEHLILAKGWSTQYLLCLPKALDFFIQLMELYLDVF